MQVRDALAAVDALQCLTLEGRANQTRCGTGEAHGGSYPSKLGKIPPIDGGKIVLAGYSLGGNVALHAAATAPPSAFAAVAAFAAFTPYRTDTNDRPTGGLRRLYEMHALLPRLGLFAADPREVPYDYDELLTSLAPRTMTPAPPTPARSNPWHRQQHSISRSHSAPHSRRPTDAARPNTTHTTLKHTKFTAMHTTRP